MPGVRLGRLRQDDAAAHDRDVDLGHERRRRRRHRRLRLRVPRPHEHQAAAGGRRRRHRRRPRGGHAAPHDARPGARSAATAARRGRRRAPHRLQQAAATDPADHRLDRRFRRDGGDVHQRRRLVRRCVDGGVGRADPATRDRRAPGGHPHRVTADRYNAVPSRIHSAVACRIVLRHADVSAYSDHGIPGERARNLDLPPGRGLLQGSTLVQIASVSKDPAAKSQGDRIVAFADRLGRERTSRVAQRAAAGTRSRSTRSTSLGTTGCGHASVSAMSVVPRCWSTSSGPTSPCAARRDRRPVDRARHDRPLAWRRARRVRRRSGIQSIGNVRPRTAARSCRHRQAGGGRRVARPARQPRRDGTGLATHACS